MINKISKWFLRLCLASVIVYPFIKSQKWIGYIDNALTFYEAVNWIAGSIFLLWSLIVVCADKEKYSDSGEIKLSKKSWIIGITYIAAIVSSGILSGDVSMCISLIFVYGGSRAAYHAATKFKKQ